MIRRACFHVAMARLALIAALLLAAVPTLGRLAPQVVQLAQGARAQLVALCTSDGLRYVDLATQHGDAQYAVDQQAGAAHHDGHPGAPPEKPHDHGAPDCAYCPLLLSLLVAAAWLLWLRAATARGALPTWTDLPSCTFVHPCGLGSRGPPRHGASLRA
jgi:hypothetical protein